MLKRTGKILKWPSRNRTARWFYNKQPFSSEKSMRPLYIVFHPKFNGDQKSVIWAQYKIKYIYTIGLYHIDNNLMQKDKLAMNNRT